MAVIEQDLTDEYAIYNGDSCEVIPTLPDQSVHLSVYSPPFCGLFNYSSSDRDMSNSATYDEFLDHYEFLVGQIARVTKPGRMSCVHAMDIPNPGQRSGYYDLPGKTIDLHQRAGFHFLGRIVIWKEPLRVAIRTRLKHLTHKQLVKDSCHSTIASGDQLLIFKKGGENLEPVSHPTGFDYYAGATPVPDELERFKGEKRQELNRLSQWIWRRYASCIWDDVRVDRILPYKAGKDPDDEKHVHPLQLDVIERCVQMWSNPGDVVLTPFMGVGSEVYGAVTMGRRAIGVELKPSYFRQAKRNLASALDKIASGVERSLFDAAEPAEAEEFSEVDEAEV